MYADERKAAWKRYHAHVKLLHPGWRGIEYKALY